MNGGGTLDGWLKRAIHELQAYVQLTGQVARALFTPPIYWRDIVEQLELIGVGDSAGVVGKGGRG